MDTINQITSECFNALCQLRELDGPTSPELVHGQLEKFVAGLREKAVAAGASPQSIEIVDVEDVPLSYLPGNATRIHVKAVGDLHGG